MLAFAAVFAALTFCGAGQAKTSCAVRVLDDWRDGRINGEYSVACYQAALAQMPEDLRIYSSAESDIKRALVDRIGKDRVAQAPSVAQARKPTESRGHGVSPLIVLAIIVAILAATGSVLALQR